MILWGDSPSATQVITDAEPADGAGAITGTSITNDTDLETHMTLEFEFTFGTSPGTGKSLKVYFLLSSDGGTTHEDGDASTQPNRAPDAVVAVRAVTSAQRVMLGPIPIPPNDFHILVWNDTGQSISTNTLQVYEQRYAYEVQ